ncbi:hypothetical protein, conserved [Plasmodium gonderi]|uniref:C3H1-type domain-containing protein n=1 Tax=Plasmodium gonderi TaxID=77519 RepID=A0A1Y1JN14_PLAGO|nr:hypothetical protein, conserved [Plasmodium gonderi]GAW82835.1 hypothetical protein, conserved [Plasmodium gonderi]
MNDKSHKHAHQVQSETLSLIKKQFFKTKLCPFQKNKNYCLNESNCHYAHSIDELKPMPDLRNTKLCDYVKKKMPCRNINCKFAHDIDTLKPSVHLATYKSTICSFWGKGKCFNGSKCRFAHGTEDIKTNENIDMIECSNYNKKNKNKIKSNITDLKQGTASTYSFNTCDYSINASSENTNVSSSYDKDTDIFMLKSSITNNEKTKRKNKSNNFHSNNEVLAQDTNENLRQEITDANIQFCASRNRNSIKEVINKIENIALSTFIENNDKYTKVIKYLLNENNLLKESIKKEKVNTIVEEEHSQKMRMKHNDVISGDMKMEGTKPDSMNNDRSYANRNFTNRHCTNQNSTNRNCINQNSNETHFGYTSTMVAEEKNSKCKMNSDDLSKYVLPEVVSNNFLFTNEKRNPNYIMSNLDDEMKADDNLNNIIKTIDDILISQNVESFPSVNDTYSPYEYKDAFAVKNNSDMVNREYENLLSNLKSFESVRNAYPNVNSENIVDNSKQLICDIIEQDVSDQAFEKSILNYEPQGRKKKNCYEEKFVGPVSRLIPYGISFNGSMENGSMNNGSMDNGSMDNGSMINAKKSVRSTSFTTHLQELDELGPFKDFSPFALHHKEFPNQDLTLNQKQKTTQMQKMNKDELSRNIDIDTWKNEMILLRDDKKTRAIDNHDSVGDLSNLNYMKSNGSNDDVRGIVDNGFSTNTHSVNGFSTNTHSVNGFSTNAHSMNGFSTNVHSRNGFSTNAHSMNGFSTNGFITKAFPINDNFGGVGEANKRRSCGKNQIPPHLSNSKNKNSSYMNSSNMVNSNLMQKKLRDSTTMVKEKNAKLNLREFPDLNDNGMNMDKSSPFINDKYDILKKIKCLISNELLYNEINNTHSSMKNINYINSLNENNYLLKKNIQLNDSVHSTSNCNTSIPDIHNLTFLNNNNIENNNNSWFDKVNNGHNVGTRNADLNDENSCVLLNMDFSNYKKEGNNENDIWNSSSNLNEFVYPMISHGWMNEKKNDDFFTISKSVNMSSLN